MIGGNDENSYIDSDDDCISNTHTTTNNNNNSDNPLDSYLFSETLVNASAASSLPKQTKKSLARNQSQKDKLRHEKLQKLTDEARVDIEELKQQKNIDEKEIKRLGREVDVLRHRLAGV